MSNPLFLGYSTNVHRGESLDEVYRYLRAYTIPVKQKVFGNRPGGLELRLGIAAARDLQGRKRREAFAAFLKEAQLEIFSINAYPLLDFQARRVKEKVYTPSWTDRARTDWTIKISEILADLLPLGRTGSVSTLGGTYRPWGHGEAVFRTIAANYLKVLSAFEDIEQRTGKSLILAVEPEPDTTFETAEDVVRFFEDFCLPAARENWKRRFRTSSALEGALRRRFTVNLDTCHFSVVFRKPETAMQTLQRAGIAVGKIHVTNALALRNPLRSPRGYQDFRDMDEPRFLHQFRGRDAEGKVVLAGQDLNRLPRDLKNWKRSLKALRPPVAEAPAELRTHFHVPLYLRRFKNLHTTQDETLRAVQKARAENSCSQFVIETYTWPVLAREDQLLRGIAREFRWLLGALDLSPEG